MLEIFPTFFIPVPKEEIGFSPFGIKILQKHFIQCNESIFYLYLWEKILFTDCTRYDEPKLLLEIWNCFAIESINVALLECIHGIFFHIVNKLNIVFMNANFTDQH